MGGKYIEQTEVPQQIVMVEQTPFYLDSGVWMAGLTFGTAVFGYLARKQIGRVGSKMKKKVMKKK